MTSIQESMKNVVQLLENSETNVVSASIDEAVGPNQILMQTVHSAIKGMLHSQDKQTENVQSLLRLHDRVREIERKLGDTESRNEHFCVSASTGSQEARDEMNSSVNRFNPPIPFLREIDCNGNREPISVFPITHDQWRLHDGKNRDFAIRVVGSEAACHIPLGIPGVDKKQFSLQLVVRDGKSMLRVCNLSNSENLAVLKKFHDGPFLNVGDILYVGVDGVKASGNGRVEREPISYRAKFIVDHCTTK